MAVCLVYVIYKQYLFSLSSRIIAGVVYFTAAIVAFLPILFFDWNMNHILSVQMKGFDRQTIIVFVIAAMSVVCFDFSLCKEKSGIYPVAKEEIYCGSSDRVSG